MNETKKPSELIELIDHYARAESDVTEIGRDFGYASDEFLAECMHIRETLQEIQRRLKELERPA